MSQTAYFAPPSPATDRVTQEAVTVEKGSSVNLNSSERLISELPKCTAGAEVNKTMCPVPVIGPGPLFSSVKRQRERLSAGSPVKVMMPSAGCVVFAAVPFVLSQLIQLLLCGGRVRTAVLRGQRTRLCARRD